MNPATSTAQPRAHILECLYAGLVPFVRSSPGMGNSCINRSVVEELDLWMIDHRLSTSEPTDLSGLPNFKDGKARFVPFEELFPIEDLPSPYPAEFDFVGMPALAMNGGFDKRGAPIGFQLVGKHLSEDLLLKAGHAFQSITDWHTRHPALD